MPIKCPLNIGKLLKCADEIGDFYCPVVTGPPPLVHWLFLPIFINRINDFLDIFGQGLQCTLQFTLPRMWKILFPFLFNASCCYSCNYNLPVG